MDRILKFVCDKGHSTVTVQREPGSTPLSIVCRESDCQCKAIMQFMKQPKTLIPEWEWYKPSDDDIKDQLRKMNLPKKEYDRVYANYKSRDLMLRKIETL